MPDSKDVPMTDASTEAPPTPEPVFEPEPEMKDPDAPVAWTPATYGEGRETRVPAGGSTALLASAAIRCWLAPLLVGALAFFGNCLH